MSLWNYSATGMPDAPYNPNCTLWQYNAGLIASTGFHVETQLRCPSASLCSHPRCAIALAVLSPSLCSHPRCALTLQDPAAPDVC